MKRTVWLMLMISIVLHPAIAGAGGAPRFTIDIDGAEKIEWTEEGKGILFSIHSRRGIGRATLTPEDGGWPPRVAFRLHLKGLERFRVDNGRFTVTTSLSSLPPHDVRCELRRPGEGAVSISETDSLWTPVVVVPGKGSPHRIPLEHGWIEVRPPGELLEEETDVLEIHWVDFFR